MTGYLHPTYAESFAEVGIPHKLPRCGGWLIKRQIPGFSNYDAMGCYPLFLCRDWSNLKEDLDDLGTELICLSIVTDPFGEFDKTYLNKCFKNRVVPYKEHYIIDLRRSPGSFVSKHHQRNSKKALQELKVEKYDNPVELLDEWNELYSTLIARHQIKGILAFSNVAFKKQLSVPGIAVFRAVYEEKTVGMLLWYIQDKIAYYHLGANDELGYKKRASFALFGFAIDYFAATGLKLLDLGAGAGVKSKSKDGLSRFKSGWSTGTSTVYFCGRVFDAKRYSEILQHKGLANNRYFPAYRKGEFV